MGQHGLTCKTRNIDMNLNGFNNFIFYNYFLFDYMIIKIDVHRKATK